MGEMYLNLDDLPDDMRAWIENQIRLYGRPDRRPATVHDETQKWLEGYAPDEEMTATAVVIASKQCCAENLHDAIGVSAFTPAFSKARFKESHGDPSMRGLIIGVFDEHSHSTSEALIDVEDGKELVNRLMVAISAAEGR